MSENLPPMPPLPEEPSEQGAGRARRAASVTLRQGGGADDAAMLDPATQSLADALRITYRVLQLAMVVLIGLFLFSGFQSVSEQEVAIRLTFGRPVGESLRSGFQYSWPYPIGELEKVPTGLKTLSVDDAFFPQLTDEERRMEITQLAGRGRNALNPERDGSVLTADGNIAHTRAVVSYRVERPVMALENIFQDDEQNMVLHAVRAGIVQAAASMSIDEFLKNQPDDTRAPGEFRSAEAVALEVAQRKLEELDSGIVIEQLSLTDRTAPLNVVPAFDEVQKAQAKANAAAQEAEARRLSILNNAAGEASEYILEEIARYEEAIETEDLEVADAAFERIEALLTGRPVQVNGQTVRPSVFGRVTQIIGDAESYRASRANEMAALASQFNAFRASFASNPTVVIHSAWNDAFQQFLSQENIQVQMLPDGLGKTVVLISRDAEVARAQETERRLREADEARQRRQRELERQQYEERLRAQNVADSR